MFQSGADLREVSLPTGEAPRTLVHIGAVTVVGITSDGSNVYWAATNGQAGAHDAIWRVDRGGGHAMEIARDVSVVPSGLVQVDGYLYWVDAAGIGRVGVDGRDLDRRFIPLHPGADGEVASGLATDGHALYFSRCEESAIARVSLAGGQPDLHFVELGQRQCPQNLVLTSDYIYWTSLGFSTEGGAVGRAGLRDGKPQTRWFQTGGVDGPNSVAADASYVYWTWGGTAGAPVYVARMATTRTGLVRKFLIGGDALCLVFQ